MFAVKIRQGVLLAVLSAIPFTLWDIVRTLPLVPRYGDQNWLMQGALTWFFLFTLGGCWNSIGAAAALSMASSFPAVPPATRYAGAFLGALLTSFLGYLILDVLMPSRYSQEVLPRITGEMLCMSVASAALLTAGFYSLERRSVRSR